MALIVDTDSKSVCVYKELELVRYVPIALYDFLSVDNLIDICGETLKKEWRKIL